MPNRFLEKMLDPRFFLKLWVVSVATALAFSIAAICVIVHFISRAW